MGILDRIISSFKEERNKQKLEEKIGRELKEECKWRYIPRNTVPKWLEKAFWKAWSKASDRDRKWLGYGKTYYFKGKNYLYKAVVGYPRFQGDTPRKFYKRKRKEVVAKKVISEERKKKR